jgi:hypothetical protein
MKVTILSLLFTLAMAYPQSSPAFPISTSCSGWCPGERMCTMEITADGKPVRQDRFAPTINTNEVRTTAKCKIGVAQELHHVKHLLQHKERHKLRTREARKKPTMMMMTSQDQEDMDQ